MREAQRTSCGSQAVYEQSMKRRRTSSCSDLRHQAHNNAMETDLLRPWLPKYHLPIRPPKNDLIADRAADAGGSSPDYYA